MSPLGSILSYTLPMKSRLQPFSVPTDSKPGTSGTSHTSDALEAMATKSVKPNQNFLLVGSSNLSITKLSFAEYDPSEYVRRSIDGNIDVSEAIRRAEKPIPANDAYQFDNLVTSTFEDAAPQGNGFENTPIFSEAETTALIELYTVTQDKPEVKLELEMIA